MPRSTTSIRRWRRCGSGLSRFEPRGSVGKVGGFKDYEPRDQVHARLQLTGRGLVKKPVAGIDVRGNGEFVPYRGGIRREELDPSNHDTPFDLVRETLA